MSDKCGFCVLRITKEAVSISKEEDGRDDESVKNREGKNIRCSERCQAWLRDTAPKKIRLSSVGVGETK